MPGMTMGGPHTHREASRASEPRAPAPPLISVMPGSPRLFPNSLWIWLAIHWPGRVTIAPMAEPASTLAAGSVGTVVTQYLDLPEPVRLDCGRELYPIRVAYETYGALSPRRDNAILVCHALSGEAHAADFAKAPPESSTRDGFAAEDRDGMAGKALGWWYGMIGPGKA